MTNKINYYNLMKKVNKMFKDNRNAKTQEARINVVNNHAELMDQLALSCKDLDLDNEMLSEDNHYSGLMNEINTWITNGSDDKPKNFKAKLKNENPSNLQDNMATNHRIYRGGRNYFKNGNLKPTDAELHNNKTIKDLYNQLKELQATKGGNRYKISKAIREVKDDLELTITNARGIDEFNRVDNTITPKDPINVKSLNNEAYKRFLITTNLSEISQENHRLDKMVITKELRLNGQIFKDLENGYNQSETARRNHVSQSKISKLIKKTIQTPITE